jgi:hypothetical protein
MGHDNNTALCNTAMALEKIASIQKHSLHHYNKTPTHVPTQSCEQRNVARNPRFHPRCPFQPMYPLLTPDQGEDFDHSLLL